MKLGCVVVLLFTCVSAAAGEHATSRELLTLGWSSAGVRADQWKPEPWRVDKLGEGTVTETERGVRFEVSTPNTAMAWTLTVPPIWTRDFSAVEIRRTLGGVHHSGYRAFFFNDGSTGPVTPGANNVENPLASGNAASATLRAGEETSGESLSQWLLLQAGRPDRVSEITVLVHAGAGAATLELNTLRFWQGLPREADADLAALRGRLEMAEGGEESADPILDLEQARSDEADRRAAWPMLVLDAGEAPVPFQPVPLQMPNVPLVELAEALEMRWQPPAADEVIFAGLPFRLDSRAAAQATSLQHQEPIVLSAAGRGGALALLLATRIFGSDQPWYGGDTGSLRTHLESALDACVELHYADGTTHAALPLQAGAGTHGFQSGLHAYTLPLDPERSLQEVRLHDKVDHGQLILLAASVLEKVGEEPPQPAPARATSAADWIPGLRLEGDVLEISLPGAMARIRLSEGCELVELRLPGSDGNAISAPSTLLEVQHPRSTPLPLKLVSARIEGTAAHVAWQDPEGHIAVHAEITLDREETITVHPRIHATGDAPRELTILCPRIAGLSVADHEAVDYLLGTRTPVLAGNPRTLDEVYGGGYLLQLLDVHSAEGGAGLGLIVKDAELFRKWFQFQHHADERSDFQVEYREILIAPGEETQLPPYTLIPHAGDWRHTFEQYRGWVCEALPAPPVTHGMNRQFYCRRDYPFGGTGYLYDLRDHRYTPDRLVRESLEAFGGVDLIDISSWAYNENTGRVGNYVENEIGGLPALKAATAQAHAEGVGLGLYFEGYLIDKRVPLAEQALPDWQLIKRDGEGMWWPGEMELFCCPGVPAWREALAAQVVAVAADTGVDAVYLDQLGNTQPGKECWSPGHGHAVPSNPNWEEREMIRVVREALQARGLNTALYIEHVPADALAPLIDGAFNICIVNTVETHPTRLPLQRFVFPHVAIFEMLAHGIRPAPAHARGMHLAFFNGLGLWLKGRADSWFSPALQEAARQRYPVYQQYGHLFRSPDCQPLIPTLQEGLYAHRFSSGGESLITLYNGGPDTVAGAMLAIPGEMAGEARDAFTGEPVERVRSAQGEVLHGVVHPGQSWAILLQQTPAR